MSDPKYLETVAQWNQLCDTAKDAGLEVCLSPAPDHRVTITHPQYLEVYNTVSLDEAKAFLDGWSAKQRIREEVRRLQEEQDAETARKEAIG